MLERGSALDPVIFIAILAGYTLGAWVIIIAVKRVLTITGRLVNGQSLRARMCGFAYIIQSVNVRIISALKSIDPP